MSFGPCGGSARHWLVLRKKIYDISCTDLIESFFFSSLEEIFDIMSEVTMCLCGEDSGGVKL